MLINKNTGMLKEDETLIFKMTSGEEVIAKIVSINEDSICLYRPCSLVLSQQGPSLNKWLILADKDKNVEIKLSAIMAYCAPESSAVEHYESITSNIVKAPAGIIAD